MIKQTIMFSNPVSLTVKDLQLVITSKDSGEVITRPIEDIGFVIINNPMIRISVPLINTLSDYNVGLIFCDDRQMPKSMLMNLDANATQQESYRYQIGASQPVNKQLWKQIIENKIRNQAALLIKVGKDGDILRPYYMNVKSGDSNNREGVAAKMYWNTLLGNEFVRDRFGDSPNNLLNYGYSILRAAISRALMGSGLSPTIGIFHKNRYNSFPLSDDVMEPYRPFVDEIVYDIFQEGKSDELTNEVKQKLLRVLFMDTDFNNYTRPLEVSISLTTASLAKVYRGESRNILYPKLI